MAEAGQMSISSSKDIIKSSYHQQQTPLSYYFSSFSKQVWKDKKFTMRFHAMGFYLLLSLIFPLALYSVFSNLGITLFGSLLFSLNHAIRLHAVDGRPLMLALFTGLLFFFFYLSSFNKKPKLLTLIASQYLFVVSIGLQPVILVLSTFLSSFQLFWHRKKETFKTLFLSNVITAVLVLPYYTYMYLFARSAHKYYPSSFDRLEGYIQGLGLREFIERYFASYNKMIFFLIFLILLWSIVVIFQRKMSQQAFTTGMTTLVFLLFFDAIYSIFINWALNHWYFIVLGIPLVFFVTSILNDTLSFFLKRKEKFFVLLPLLIIFLWNAYNQIIFFNDKARFYFPYRDNDIERMYHYLKENGHPDDVVIQLSLVPIPQWRGGRLYIFESFFYQSGIHPLLLSRYIQVTETPPFFHEGQHDIIYYIDWSNISTKKNQKLFIVTNNEGQEDKAKDILPQFTKEYRIGNFSVFTFSLNKENREEQYKDLLYRLLKKTPSKHSTVFYETLLYYACKNGDDKRHEELLRKYEALEPLLDEFTGRLQFPSRFALKRRVKVFKKQQYCQED